MTLYSTLVLVLTFAKSTRAFLKYKTESAENYLARGGLFSLARAERGVWERIQEIFNDDLEEIATWRQNDLLAIQNGDRLFGAKIDLETYNAANIIEGLCIQGEDTGIKANNYLGSPCSVYTEPNR